MTIRYLTRAQPVNLTNGIGQAQLTPDTGQLWIPRLIRVGINVASTRKYGVEPANNPPIACTLFHGGIGDVGADAYVDGTANGTGDVTGIMNGTLIQPGEFLTADWAPLDLQNPAFPSQSGYLQVLGLSADTITEATAALASAVPGPSFQSELPSPMHMPPAANTGGTFIFANPGQNNTVLLINPATGDYLYVYSLEIVPYQSGSGAEGIFTPIGAASTSIGFVNPVSYMGPTYVRLDGFKMQPNGLQFYQTGNAAPNLLSYSATSTHRFMAF